MASLTHVCMWSDNGWKRITAEQAAKLHPGGTVSAHSGLFMCELCGQYVILTDGDVRVRYFKHSAYEKSKDCPERTFGPGYSIAYNPQEHDLPFRITDISASSFRFEIGFIRVPLEFLSQGFKVQITPVGAAEKSFIYTKERFHYDGITYLSVGEKPFEKYKLIIQNGDGKLRELWPDMINGVNSDGTLFEKSSGNKLSYDADVQIGKEYYLLKRGLLYRKSNHVIQIREIAKMQSGWQTWALYVVSASVFHEDAARFFLDYHCRLTEHPVSLQPVWPLFTEGSYLVKHNQKSMYMLIDGNVASVKTFPTVRVRQLSSTSSHPQLYEVLCAGRQQLISAGRTKALQYTYFWKEPLDQQGLPPEVFVRTIDGIEMPSGEVFTLPPGRSLCITASFDGEVVVLKRNLVIDRQKIIADKMVEVNNLTFGYYIQVVIGLDVVWQVSIKQQSNLGTKEDELLRRIKAVSGPTIQAPHSLRNILAGMDCYPKICQWIRSCIKSDSINEQSYRILQNAYRSMNL